jgi:hypothetical protein
MTATPRKTDRATVHPEAERTNSPIDDLLARLERVKPSGPNRWIAACPGPLHRRGDRNPSLSITTGDDGRVLMRCFSGCDAPSILSALGMSLADLFPKRDHQGDSLPTHHRPRLNARELLHILHREASIVWLAAEDLRLGFPLAEPDRKRLDLACSRIAAAYAEVQHG